MPEREISQESRRSYAFFSNRPSLNSRACCVIASSPIGVSLLFDEWQMNTMRHARFKSCLLMNLRLSTGLILSILLGIAGAHRSGAEMVVRQLGEGEEISFKREVMPAIQKLGCSAGKCHGSFSGRGGLRLSLWGSDPAIDYEGLVQQNRSRRVNPAAADRSLMLLKPTTRVPHEGGHRLIANSPAYHIFRQWIAQGVNPMTADKGRVERLEISPSEVRLQPKGSTRLKVTAHWSDGLVQNVTEWAVYDVRESAVAEVASDGTIRGTNPGRTSVTVQYLGRNEAVPVSVPYGKTKKIVGFEPLNFIDELIVKEWEKMGVTPAPIADDYEFLRRINLNVIGTLPTPDEIQDFVASENPQKRSLLVDSLLTRPEYVDFWTLKWGDLLRVHRRFLGDKGMWSFHDWLARAIRENKPVDQMTRELITARGDLYSSGAVGYYFVDGKPEELAETTAQVFLGVRMQCARCHDHPLEIWKRADYFGLANYFARITKKDNGDGGRFGGARLIGVSAKPTKAMRPVMRMEPRAFGTELDEKAAANDIREHLAAWITAKENPFFARNWANRYWSYMMGRGLIEPVDDLRGSNPASIPALLNALANDFVNHGYDVKHLIRLICNSRVYQLASEVAPRRDAEGKFYTHSRYQRLSAQVLADAIDQATGVPEQYEGAPLGRRAVQLPDPKIRSEFLSAFGRSERASPCECASSNAPDLAQALQLLNSDSVNQKIIHNSGRLTALLAGRKSDEQIVETLYLLTLSRPPSPVEMDRVKRELARAPSREEGFQDLLWALLNSSKFVYQH